MLCAATDAQFGQARQHLASLQAQEIKMLGSDTVLVVHCFPIHGGVSHHFSKGDKIVASDIHAAAQHSPPVKLNLFSVSEIHVFNMKN